MNHMDLAFSLLMRPPCQLDSSFRLLPTPGATKINRQQLYDTIQEALNLLDDDADYLFLEEQCPTFSKHGSNTSSIPRPSSQQ
jgi:hypothetical protein